MKGYSHFGYLWHINRRIVHIVRMYCKDSPGTKNNKTSKYCTVIPGFSYFNVETCQFYFFLCICCIVYELQATIFFIIVFLRDTSQYWAFSGGFALINALQAILYSAAFSQWGKMLVFLFTKALFTSHFLLSYAGIGLYIFPDICL